MSRPTPTGHPRRSCHRRSAPDPPAWAQPAIIAASALAGLVWLRPDVEMPAAGEEEDFPDARVPRVIALGSLATFLVLLVAVPFLPRLFGIFYRAGALVFGGGHVVLPLLESGLVPSGLVGHDEFLAGYGAAQAVPGPLFTVAAYLGAIAEGVPGALLALFAIFLPAALLVVGVLPFWQSLRPVPMARAALMGVNAGVVGLLAGALYDPVFTDGITSARALALAVVAFVLLTRWPVPAWAVVVAAAAVGAVAL